MKTPRVLGVKFAWALPAIALLLFAFAEPEFKVKEAKVENQQSNVQKSVKEQVIHGKVVKEENKKPLAGASIIIKGTSIGTVSDFDGNFTLTNPNPEVDEKTGGLITEFVISYVGYQTVSERFGPVLGQPDKEGVTTSYDFPLREGVIVIDLPDYKNVPPPPPPPTVKNVGIDNNEEIFIVVEDLPKYPGGIYDLAKYVAEKQENLGKGKNWKGKVKVGFTVDETGKVTNIKIVNKGHKFTAGETKYSEVLLEDPKAEEAAVAIVAGMKDWKPGSQRGKKVPVNYILPVEFK